MAEALLFEQDKVDIATDWEDRIHRLGRSSLLWVDIGEPEDAALQHLGRTVELDDACWSGCCRQGTSPSWVTLVRTSTRHENARRATRRTQAGITRGQLAEASGISQYKIDRIERGVDVAEETRKAYNTGLGKLLAAAKKAPTNGTKSAAKKTTARTRKAETAA